MVGLAVKAKGMEKIKSTATFPPNILLWWYVASAT